METCKFHFSIFNDIAIVKINMSSAGLIHRHYWNSPCKSLFVYCNKINCVSFLILLPLTFALKYNYNFLEGFCLLFSLSLGPPHGKHTLSDVVEGTVLISFYPGFILWWNKCAQGHRHVSPTKKEKRCLSPNPQHL